MNDRLTAVAGVREAEGVPRAVPGPALAEPAASELTVIVPCLNERGNVVPLLEALRAALAGCRWEVIFVDDDSSDGTAAFVREIARHDPQVRCLQRVDRRGLSSACIEGVLASAAPFIAVIDADLQHDESLLPEMLRLLKAEPLDIVIGSRYVAGAGADGMSATRQRMTGLATRLSRLIVRAELADPMSGFFMLRRETFEAALRALSGQGFKILLDLFASAPAPLRFRELPYRFRQRQHGESKLDALVAWEYAMLLLDKLVGHIVPVRFVLFSLIGVVGLAVHLVVLWLVLIGLGASFPLAQAVATMVAMTSNFTLNNIFTYRDQRLRGWRFLTGLLSFAVVCGVGAIANVGAATLVYRKQEVWWVAGVAGAVLGAVWNYAVSSVVTWRKAR